MTLFEKAPPTRQDYESPAELIEAVELRFGRLTFDLAATHENAKAENCYTLAEDSLAQDWTRLVGNAWCNPPYADIEPWARKAALSLETVRRDPKRRDRRDWRLIMLTPASVGSNWFADHVHGRALVIALRPRISFVGTTGTDRRDYILSVYGETLGFQTWRWQP